MIGMPHDNKGNMIVPVSTLPDVVETFKDVAGQACIFLWNNIQAAYKPQPHSRYSNTYSLREAALHCQITAHTKTLGNDAFITVTCKLGNGIYHRALYGEYAGQKVNTLALLDYGYEWDEPPRSGHIPWFTVRQKGYITEKTREQVINYAGTLGLKVDVNIEYDNPIG